VFLFSRARASRLTLPLLALALPTGLAAGDALAQTTTAQACSTLQAEMGELGLRYVQALDELSVAIDAHEAAAAAARVAIEEQRQRIDQVLDQDLVTGSFVREITVFVSLAEIQTLQDRVRDRERRMERAANAAALLEQTLLAVTAFMDRACADAGTAAPTTASAAPDAPSTTVPTTVPTAVPTAADGTPAAPATADSATAALAPMEGFWGDSMGREYYVSGGVFHRLDDGSVALSLSCAGRGTNLAGVEGELCTGQHLNRAGELQGTYEGVYRVHAGEGETRVDGFYGWTGYDGRYGWNLGRISDAEVAERGLVFNPR